MPGHPFGTEISAADIVESLSFLDGWEERYRYIIDLGRELPAMPPEERREERLVRGCQSQVWLDWSRDDAGLLHFRIDSEAHIVRGLVALILAAYEGKSPVDVLAFDVDGYFQRLDLISHLSPTRGNGLRAMVARIRDVAAAQAGP